MADKFKFDLDLVDWYRGIDGEPRRIPSDFEYSEQRPPVRPEYDAVLAERMSMGYRERVPARMSTGSTYPTRQGVQVRGFSFTVRAIQVDMSYDLREPVMIVKIVADILNRDTGSPTQLAFAETYPASMGEPMAIRRCLHAMLLHEADECIYVNGERVYDPHKSDNEQFIPRR